jgi:hypothetical protein
MTGIRAPRLFVSPFARGDGVNEPSTNRRADIINATPFAGLPQTPSCSRRCRLDDLPFPHRRGGSGPP